MRQNAHLAIALVVVVSMVLAAPMAAATGAFADDHENQTDAEISPGERLGGALGAQQAELDGELAERSFVIGVANAATDEEAADVVADRLGTVEERIENLEDRKAALDAEREAGNVSQGQYAAAVASIEAERASLDRQLDRANDTAGELPEDVLAERGVNVDAIQTLKDRAGELGGDEVSELAQSIAGPDVGQSVAEDQRPDHAGPPSDDDEDDEESDERGAGDDRGADERDDRTGGDEETDDEQAGDEQETDEEEHDDDHDEDGSDDTTDDEQEYDDNQPALRF